MTYSPTFNIGVMTPPMSFLSRPKRD